MDVITQMQASGLIPEPYLVGPDCDIAPVVQDALQRDIKLIVVCGGDGTIENVAESLIDSDAALGIIPTGTRNNVALSLGIPEDIPAAVALLEKGRTVKIDVGYATCGERSHLFLETCSIGLISALFPAADDIQHGNLARIGDFLATLIHSPAAEMRLVIDAERQINTQGHVVLVANLPYTGPHYQIAAPESYDDGLLDLLVFSDLSKLELLSNMAQIPGSETEDPRIQRYHAKKVEINTSPPMPVMADGFSLGEGPLSIDIRQCALSVMAGEPFLAKELIMYREFQ